MWQWEHEQSGKCLYVNRDIARDKNMFRKPGDEVDGGRITLHTGEISDVGYWQWPGDERVFLIPAEIFERGIVPSGLLRDVVACVGQMYRDENFPADRNIYTYGRKIAEAVGLSWNGRVGNTIDDVICFARFYTVRNYKIIKKLDKKGKVEKYEYANFGFFDETARVVEVKNGKETPRNKQPYRLMLSHMYANAIRNFPPAPLPAAALEIAHAAPWKIQDAVKNIAYYIAARVPMREIRLLLPTLREIFNLTGDRNDKLRKTAEQIFSMLNPIMIRNYHYIQDGYNILLNGKIVKK